jgi:cobalt/nickel transport system ATP-binding protein
MPHLNPYPLFRLSRVSYRYKSRFPAVSDIDLIIRNGEKIAVLGAMRAGKSSLLKILQGRLTPEKGIVYFLEKPLTSENISFLQSRVGFAGQFPDEQLFRPTILDDLVYGSGLMNHVSGPQMGKIEKVCQRLGIQDVFDRPSGELSGSEKKLVSIAASLAFNPEILILDEPTAGLSPYLKDQVQSLIKDSNYAPATVIFSTNDLDIAKSLSMRTLLLSPDHRIMADGPTSNILDDSHLLIESRMIHEHVHFHHGTPHYHRHAHDREHGHRHGSEENAREGEMKVDRSVTAFRSKD